MILLHSNYSIAHITLQMHQCKQIRDSNFYTKPGELHHRYGTAEWASGSLHSSQESSEKTTATCCLAPDLMGIRLPIVCKAHPTDPAQAQNWAVFQQSWPWDKIKCSKPLSCFLSHLPHWGHAHSPPTTLLGSILTLPSLLFQHQPHRTAQCLGYGRYLVNTKPRGAVEVTGLSPGRAGALRPDRIYFHRAEAGRPQAPSGPRQRYGTAALPGGGGEVCWQHPGPDPGTALMGSHPARRFRVSAQLGPARAQAPQRRPAPPQPSEAREEPRRTAPAPPPAQPRAAARPPGPAAGFLKPRRREQRPGAVPPAPTPSRGSLRRKGRELTHAPLRVAASRHAAAASRRRCGVTARGETAAPARRRRGAGVGGRAGPPRGGWGLRWVAPGSGVTFACPCAALLLPALCSGWLRSLWATHLAWSFWPFVSFVLTDARTSWAGRDLKGHGSYPCAVGRAAPSSSGCPGPHPTRPWVPPGMGPSSACVPFCHTAAPLSLVSSAVSITTNSLEICQDPWAHLPQLFCRVTAVCWKRGG